MADNKDTAPAAAPAPAPAPATATASNPHDPLLDVRPPSAADRREQIAASREVARQDVIAATEPAKIAAAPATVLEGSGTFVEPGAKKVIDVDHPAVDNNPRATTTEHMNRIDFNDPDVPDRDAVADALSK